jgi:AcrR family transcriptional regulator
MADFEKHQCFLSVCYRFSTMPATRNQRPLAAQKLPRGGRHPLTQEAVAASQRARMLDAVARAVAQKGFAATTVADVIALAGVSRRTFYEQFPNIEDCFMAAYVEGMQSLLGAIRKAMRNVPEDDWRARTRVAIEAYLQALASRPEAAWAFSIEALGAGRQGLDRRAWVLSQWVAQWRALWTLRQRSEAGLLVIGDEPLLGLAGALEELVRECLRRHGASRLPQLAPAAVDLALAVLEGHSRLPATTARPRRRGAT